MTKEVVHMDKRISGILLIFIITLAGCTSAGEGLDEVAPEETPLEERRIVSLMPSNTEIIAELGLGTNLVAVTTEVSHPESVVENAEIVKMDVFELDEEQLIALEPTHILGHESSVSQYAETLGRVSETTGAEVLVVNEERAIEDIYASIRDIGDFLGEKTAAEWLVEGIERDINVQNNIFEDRSDSYEVFIHISDQPELYTAGSGTFIEDALAEIYIDNAFGDLEGYPNVSPEDVVERSPDKLVSIMGLEDDELSESIAGMPGFSELKISQPENQCNIPPDLLARPGPRIAEGLRAVGRCVYE
ncbi:ABC transporter substrate-binding protein [Salinicoccus roseus]|uniref:ABC transporter substrate-binding protein n=1 Tax=Salinicoccus roseus TaxID=45670 RepID=UPI00230076CB|nr:ABC transporter substrate-binding protein [Salinicoccus roseus]